MQTWDDEWPRRGWIAQEMAALVFAKGARLWPRRQQWRPVRSDPKINNPIRKISYFRIHTKRNTVFHKQKHQTLKSPHFGAKQLQKTTRNSLIFTSKY